MRECDPTSLWRAYIAQIACPLQLDHLTRQTERRPPKRSSASGCLHLTGTRQLPQRSCCSLTGSVDGGQAARGGRPNPGDRPQLQRPQQHDFAARRMTLVILDTNVLITDYWFGGTGFRTLFGAAAGRRAEGRRACDPSTTKLYDRQGYNPEKAASFFATY
jgi:hypothetical protein